MIAGIDEQALLERQATTANAVGEVLAKSKELVDLDIETVSPQGRERFPVIFTGCALLRKLLERVFDVGQGDADTLRGANEGNTPENITAVAPLIRCISSGKNEPFSFIEMQRRNRRTRSRGDLADRPFMKRGLRVRHLRTLSLDLNQG